MRDRLVLALAAFGFWDGVQGHFADVLLDHELLSAAVFLLVLTGAKLSRFNPLTIGAVLSTEVPQRQSEQRCPWNCQCYAQ
jgi:hypothetical protein